MEQGVTITLFIIFDNVTKYKEQSDWSSLPGHMPNLAQQHRLSYVGPESQLRLSWAE